MVDEPYDPTQGTTGKPVPRTFDAVAVGVAVALLSLYLVTLCPTIYTGDTPELATAASTFGVAHPPGYALYSLIGNLWSRLLVFGDPGWRLNLMSVVCAVSAALLLYGVVKRLGGGRLGAAYAALALGVGHTFWSQAVVSEVYAFDIMLAAALLYTSVRSFQLGTPRSLVPVALCTSMWICHRNVNAVYALAVLPIIWPVLRPCLGSIRQVSVLVMAVLLPFLSWLYLPLCAANDPLLNIGDPQTLDRFQDVVSAQIYQHLLFSGDFGQQALALLSSLPRGLGVALLLAPLGLAVWWRTPNHRRPLLGLVGFVLTNFAFASNYAAADAHAFILPLTLAIAALAGLGLAAIQTKMPTRLTGLLVGVAVASTVLLGAANFGNNDLRGQTLTRDFARDSLSFPKRDGIVLSHVDSVTFGLWYAQAVESRGPAKLLVICRGFALDWHQEWARRRRPDLDIPFYQESDTPSHWPAMLAIRNAKQVPVFVTANLLGYFQPSDRKELVKHVRERPAGLFTELHHLSRPEEPAATIARNREFWQRCWPHAVAARQLQLNEDMTALVLHYASMRVLFAHYCLLHGEADAAEAAASAVVDLEPDPLLAQINALYEQRGSRYHMSDMRVRARRIGRQAQELRSGKVSLEQIRTQPALSELPKVAAEGKALMAKGEWSAAIERFEAVLLVRPRHLQALFHRATALAKSGRKKAAIAAFEKLLGHAPESAEAWLGLAEARLPEDREGALRALQRAARTPSGTPGRDAALVKLQALQKR